MENVGDLIMSPIMFSYMKPCYVWIMVSAGGKSPVTVVAVIRGIKLKGMEKGFNHRLKHVLGSGLRG